MYTMKYSWDYNFQNLYLTCMLYLLLQQLYCITTHKNRTNSHDYNSAETILFRCINSGEESLLCFECLSLDRKCHLGNT
jgi:hypothetical protein